MKQNAEGKKHKRIFGILGGIAALAVLAIGAVVWAVWYDLSVGFGAPAHPDFGGYSTTLPLNGTALTDAKLSRTKEFGLDIWTFDYTLRYGTDGVIVYERSATGTPKGIDPCTNRTSILNPDYVYACDLYKVKNDGYFIVLTDKYKGAFSSVRLEGQIGNTSFFVSIPEKLMKTFVTFGGWQTYFDSLQPVSLQTMPFTVKTHADGGA